MCYRNLSTCLDTIHCATQTHTLSSKFTRERTMKVLARTHSDQLAKKRPVDWKIPIRNTRNVLFLLRAQPNFVVVIVVGYLPVSVVGVHRMGWKKHDTREKRGNEKGLRLRSRLKWFSCDEELPWIMKHYFKLILLLVCFSLSRISLPVSSRIISAFHLSARERETARCCFLINSVYIRLFGFSLPFR